MLAPFFKKIKEATGEEFSYTSSLGELIIIRYNYDKENIYSVTNDVGIDFSHDAFNFFSKSEAGKDFTYYVFSQEKEGPRADLHFVVKFALDFEPKIRSFNGEGTQGGSFIKNTGIEYRHPADLFADTAEEKG